VVRAGAPGRRARHLWSGDTKALRLDTNRGRLTHATAGAIVGHNGGESTISVAATNVSTAAGGTFTGGSANPVETYSSDGPRRMFYDPGGTAITPGKVTFASGGGRDLQKPDITAADCVSTTTPGFAPFCGTSAAAPHAAAIAALVKSVPSAPSGAQVLSTLSATALDVSPAGRDRNAGVGIVMAYSAVNLLAPLDFYTVAPCRVFDTRLADGPTAGAPLTCGTVYDFTMVGGTCGVPSGAKAVSLNVTVTQPSAQGNVRLFASGTPVPLVSTLNYVAGLNRANNAVAPLNAAGQMAGRCSPSGTTHLIVDVNGYFQ
jgi:subtilisin family serine protease